MTPDLLSFNVAQYQAQGFSLAHSEKLTVEATFGNSILKELVKQQGCDQMDPITALDGQQKERSLLLRVRFF